MMEEVSFPFGIFPKISARDVLGNVSLDVHRANS